MIRPTSTAAASLTRPSPTHLPLLAIDARTDGRGNPYFWLAFAKARFEPGNGSDLKAIAEHRISVTPLRLDLTDEPTLTRFAQAFAFNGQLATLRLQGVVELSLRGNLLGGVP